MTFMTNVCHYTCHAETIIPRAGSNDSVLAQGPPHLGAPQKKDKGGRKKKKKIQERVVICEFENN